MGDIIVYVDSNNRNRTLFPNSNSYTLYLTTPITNISKVEVMTAMMPDVYSSQYLSLDIQELRTPKNLVASALTLADTYSTNLGNTSAIHNLSVPDSNAFYGSFAFIPIKAATSLASNVSTFANTSYTYNNEFYGANYNIVTEYASRIDKLDRLTITWRQANNGSVFYDNLLDRDLGRNMFILKFETIMVPDEPVMTPSLPEPVKWDSGEQNKIYILAAIALVGLLVISLARRSGN
jgi:hypothetical protein